MAVNVPAWTCRRRKAAGEVKPVLMWIIVFLTLFSAAVCTEDVYEDGYSGTYGLIRSQNFPAPYSLNGLVYAHHLRCNDAIHCYVRVVFTDFDLHERSTLKIYDGEDISGSSSIWTQQDRPIYQSSSRHLLIVFKPGRPEGIKNTDSPSSWNPDAYRIDNIGFKLNYSFVTDGRQTWYNSEMGLPAKGCCDQFYGDGFTYGGATTIPRQPGGFPSLCDCIFSMASDEGYLALTMPNISWIRGGLVSVEGSRTSDGFTLLTPQPLSDEHIQGQDILLYSGIREFYISTSALLVPGEQVTFSFHRNSQTAVELLRNHLSPSSCPYKTCHEDSCVPYWEACQDLEASCDKYGELTDGMCDGDKRCYNRALEHCDGYADCLDSSDEDDCETVEFNWASVGIGCAFAFVFLVICGCSNKEKFRTRCANCRQGISRRGRRLQESLRRCCPCCTKQPTGVQPARVLPVTRSTATETEDITASGRPEDNAASAQRPTPDRRQQVFTIPSTASKADDPPSYGVAVGMPQRSLSAPHFSELFPSLSGVTLTPTDPTDPLPPPPSYAETVESSSPAAPPSQETPPRNGES